MPSKPASKPPRSKTPRSKRPPAVGEVLAELARLYPDAECALTHRTPFELLIATILSAQCTDARVNLVTKELFAKYRTPRDYTLATQEELEADIRSTGFFRNKAKNIQACCRELVKRHGGEVPDSMEALAGLAGVGRKTANVVLGNAFGKPDGVVVDTHVSRISHKLGFTTTTDPLKAERELNRLIPREQWVLYPHWVIQHGRAVCRARSPRCDACTLYPFCPTRA
jgi:endonuclease-3